MPFGPPGWQASVAADTVPEYRTLMPTLGPRLMPETTRSGARGSSSARAILTQSAGVPLTAQPWTPPSRVTFFDPQGGGQADGVPHGALLALRGHHRHVPQLAKFPVQGPQARGVDAVVIGQQDHC